MNINQVLIICMFGVMIAELKLQDIGADPATRRTLANIEFLNNNGGTNPW
ncbi:MAG: hypothetical protein ACRDFB_06095 [Rhabdochlamydiaceae bacterium]